MILINNYRHWSRISIRCWIHKDTPYLALTGELCGSFVNICEKIDRIIQRTVVRQCWKSQTLLEIINISVMIVLFTWWVWMWLTFKPTEVKSRTCVSSKANIGSDSGLSPVRPQAVIWSNAAMLLNGQLGTNASEIWLHSLGPSDAIWRWRSWSTLVQVMAYCLTAPRHYLNQSWLVISKVLWYSSEDVIIRSFQDTNQ